MCGAIGRLNQNPFVQALMFSLGMDEQLIASSGSDLDIRPNSKIPVAIGSENATKGVMANWWLFQSHDSQGYTYDKRYRSFNTRKDKLFSNRKSDFAYRRCVIPASCFYEWKGERFKIEAVDSAIAFGGLYKVWPALNPADEPHYSCSIITLPPHSKLNHIHDKSMPLMLMPEEITAWLDPEFTQIGYWQKTLESRIRQDLKVTSVDRKNPSKEIGASEIIYRD